MDMTDGNGKSSVQTDQLGFEDMWQVVIEALAQIQEDQAEIKVQLAEVVEKLANLSLDNEGFEVFED